MIFLKTVTVPANTLISAPKITNFRLTKGLIYKFECYFPSGSAGLLHCWVMVGGDWVFPRSRGETFFGDDITISFDDKLFIKEDETLLKIFAVNYDDTYEHQFQIRIGLVLKDEYIQAILPFKALKQIADVIEEMTGA